MEPGRNEQAGRQAGWPTRQQTGEDRQEGCMGQVERQADPPHSHAMGKEHVVMASFLNAMRMCSQT